MTSRKHKFYINDEVWICRMLNEPLGMRGTIKGYASYKSSKYGNKTLRLGYYLVDVNGVEHVIHESRIKHVNETVTFT